jgi:hypothetical protein
MLAAAFIILGSAVVLGAVLAVLHLRSGTAGAPPQRPPHRPPDRPPDRPPWPFAALHGSLAVAGLACLALALRGPPRGLDHGTASFGVIAAVLLTLAALVGARLLTARVFNRPIAAATIGIHATLAVSGFVILAAYIFAG